MSPAALLKTKAFQFIRTAVMKVTGQHLDLALSDLDVCDFRTDQGSHVVEVSLQMLSLCAEKVRQYQSCNTNHVK